MKSIAAISLHRSTISIGVEMIYFIRGGDAIKIGFTSKEDVQARLSNLQTASAVPLELLAEIDGDKAEERRLHQMWRELHIRGEWFEAGADLMEYIDELNGARPPRELTPQERAREAEFRRVLFLLR